MKPSAPQTPGPARGAGWIAPGSLLVLAVAAYANSFHGPFVFDDLPAVLENASIRRLWPVTDVLAPRLSDGGLTVSGRPLVNLSLAINHALGGYAVPGYHGVNLLIHVLAGLTLFGVVERTLRLCSGQALRLCSGGALRPGSGQAPQTESSYFGTETRPFAWAVAAIWMLHPLQTAAVTYVIQRAESLAGLFYLLCLYCFIRGTASEDAGRGLRTPPDETASGPRSGRTFSRPGRGRPGSMEAFPGGVRRPRPTSNPWLILSVAACLAGVASKEVVVTAPVVVFLYDRTFVAGSFGAAWRLRWRYYLGLAGAWLLLAWLVAGTGGRGGTAGFGMEVSPWEYALTQCQAIIHYLRLTVWPHPLVFDYGIATVGRLGEVWWQAIGLAALLAGTVVALVRRPVLGFIGAWFFVLLAPSSSFVPVVTQTMAEHRMYLALAAPVVLLVAGLRSLLGGRAGLVCGVLALAGGALTFVRNADYATAGALWADTVAKRPDNARAHANLGLAEQARGRLTEAEGHLRNAVALAPGSPEPLYNLAILLNRLGRTEEAMAAYREVLRSTPDHAASHNNLANLLYAAGRTEEAGRHYAEAVRLQPDAAGVRNSYGVWLLDQGRSAEALTQLEEAMRLDPQVAEHFFNAGNAGAALGRMEAAAAHYRTALGLQPDHAEAHNNLGNVLIELDRLPEAMAEFEEAVRLQPDYFAPRRTLALLLLLHLNRPGEARGHLEILARARPGDAEIAEALARARAAGP